MPIQRSLPARQKRSQERVQAALTPTPRAPFHGTPAVPQLRAQLDRGPTWKEQNHSGRKEEGPGEDGEEEEENSVEEEASDGTKGVPAPVGASQGTGGPDLAQYNQPVSHLSEPSLFAIMQQMTQSMANLQSASSSEESRPPEFKTPSMKTPEYFDDKNEVLNATSFLIGRAEKWIEPYLSNLTNKDPNYLLNSCNLFESQLFALFGDPDEVRKAEAELDSLRMNEGGHVSLYSADLRIIDTPKEEDLILGFDFLNHFHPFIDWRQGMSTFNADSKDYHDPSKMFSDVFSFANSCSALVGDSQAKSFPSSVHIPSLHSHQSLISSRDEVFKEIKDVGEDNCVSSFHLFGNMDLSPSSYHDSLELWDEEEEPEEIETIMEVFPSSYHQYLDVLSKVKAEKLPPLHACDHHIKMKGSLPPAGVIYSL
ncbi:hypothetical protein O181_001668 [Austropuccinia psidii MF-1]|uniref:Retrotransposon gag domain-containing protein n=1 Tax=Austropuccinia psidii MF-1 TaxID=1389203 RepID=A0A9Q3BB84_9BASI|nr:hypothetical protein [Austropuccinia psidii MF-1]